MRVIAIASIIVVSNALGLLAAKAVEIVGAGKSFKCTPIAVWDGDGPIWCAEGPRIRISGVAAREMDGTCRANQPCPAVGAIEARDRVVKLFGGATGELNTGHITVKSATMTCISEGGAGGGVLPLGANRQYLEISLARLFSRVELSVGPNTGVTINAKEAVLPYDLHRS
jgi:hypothetical protein